MQNGVKAVVFFEKKILLIKRDDKDRYTFPGGGIEEGEKPLEALKRELQEEINIVPKDVKLVHTLKTYSYTVYRYIVNLNSDEFSKIKLGEEGELIEWFDYSYVISKIKIHPDMHKFLCSDLFKSFIST